MGDKDPGGSLSEPPWTRRSSTSGTPSLSASNNDSGNMPRRAPSKSPFQAVPGADDTSNLNESQPLTKTSSSQSSTHSPNLNAPDGNGPSPYGTRSRNRTGNSRPNYAEDREGDIETDSQMPRKSQPPKSAHTDPILFNDNTQPNQDERRSSIPGSSTAAGKAAITQVSKESLPGMSSFAINKDSTTQPPAKRRKTAANGSSAPGVSSGPAHYAAQPQSRKQHATVPSNGLRETNMLSFENCQGYLRNNKLRADDGTVLGVNGTLTYLFHTFLHKYPSGS